MNNASGPNNKKLLKILLAIGIIAILVSVYIQYLKPFIAELLAQKSDQVRIQDLSSINSAINKFREANPNLSLGESNKIYISLSSAKPNCEGLELFAPPEGWEYRCKPESEFQKIDGQGWLPVDFTHLPKNFDFKTSLPIDPVNTADSGYYYAYVVSEKNDWVLTSLLESNKSLKETALKDGGTNPNRFEIGSDLKLWAKSSGLASYWKFNKSFDGVDDYVNVDLNGLASLPAQAGSSTEITIEFWAKPVEAKITSVIMTNPDDSANRINIHFPWVGNLIMWDYGDINAGGRLTTEFQVQWYNEMAHWVFVSGIDGMKIYRNDRIIAESKTHSIFTKGDKTLDIGRGIGQGLPLFWKGFLDEIRIYNRALDAKGVQLMYMLDH
jgi:hypothetical protein